MKNMDYMQSLIIALITGLILYAGYKDLTTRNIPNWIPLTIIVIGLIGVLITQQVTNFLLYINIILIVLTVLFYDKIGMYAGDAKIIISLLIAFPFTIITILSLILSLIPGAIMLILRIRPIPYVACISIGFTMIVVGAMLL